LIGVVNRLPVHFKDDVTLFQIAVRGRTVGRNVTDNGAFRLLRSERLGHCGGYVLRQDAEVGALDFAVLQNLVHHVAGQINGNREPDSLVSARITREDRGVDSDQVSFVVDQRSTGVAGVDRRVRLDEVLDFLNAEVAAAHRAYDPRCQGLTHSERVSDGERYVTNLHLGRITQRDIWEVGSVDLEDGDVRARIGTDNFSLHLALVAEGDSNFSRVVHHMVVGQYIALRANDYTGT
jgi:hypothetical protein